MGLKSGSRDAGLDETEDDEEQPINQETADSDELDATSEETNQGTVTTESERSPAADATAESKSQSERTNQRRSLDSIPYKLRRNKVNEGREQVPYFLREEIIDAEDELQDTLEEMLGETVYKSDYREAAMVVAQRNPEFIAEVLREWGYDLDAT